MTRAADPVAPAPAGDAPPPAPALPWTWERARARGLRLTAGSPAPADTAPARLPAADRSAGPPPADQDAGPARRLAARFSTPVWVAGLITLLGTVVRARQAFSGRSLWLDEAMIADNIVHRDYAKLLTPLAEHQGAPFGWLWLERSAVLLFGTSEGALRLVPFLAGVAVLVVTWDVGRRVLPAPLVPVAVAVAAFAPGLLRYAGEVKPYGSDALAVLALVDGGLLLTARPDGGISRRTAAVAGLLAGLAVLISFPAVLALAAVGAVVLGQRLRARDRAGARRLGVALVLPVGAFVAQLVTTIKAVRHDTALTANWDQGYPPKHAGVVDAIGWIGRAAATFSHDPLRLWPAPLVGLLVLVGLIALVRRSPIAALLVGVVVLAQLAGALTHRYPFSGRLALDLVPLVTLLLAAALIPIGDRLWSWTCVGLAAAVGLAVVLVPPAAAATRLTWSPLTGTELKPLFAQLRAARARPVLDYWFDGAASDRYAAAAGIPLAGKIGVFATAGPCDDVVAIAPAVLAGRGQVWVVAAAIPTSIIPGPPGVGRASDVAALRAHLAAVLALQSERREPGAVALHYVVRPHGPVAAPHDGRCLVRLTPATDALR